MTDPRELPKLTPDDWDQYDGEVIEPESKANGADGTEKRPRLRPIPFNQIMLSTSRLYLIKGWIPREGLTVIWGPPKCGKSFTATDAALHIALDWEYRGHRVNAGPVVYVACEGQAGLGARIEAFRRHHNLAAEPPFYLVPDTINLTREHPTLVEQIRVVLGEVMPVAVFLDTLNRSIEGSESSDEDMGAYIQAADAIREVFSCAVVIVHHCGIDGTRPRGHTSLTGAVDAQIAVKRDKDGLITCSLEWLKDGPEGAEICSKLEPVEVGTDDDDDLITSCVVVPADNHAAASRQAKVTGQAKIALDLLQKALDEAGEAPPPSNHIGGQNRVVPLTLWRTYCKSGGLSEGDNDEAFKKAWKRVRERLLSAGIIKVWDNHVWIVNAKGDKGTTGGQEGDMSPDSQGGQTGTPP